MERSVKKKRLYEYRDSIEKIKAIVSEIKDVSMLMAEDDRLDDYVDALKDHMSNEIDRSQKAMQDIIDASSRLTVKQEHAILLKFIDGMSTAQISNKIGGLSENSVGSLISRSINQIEFN